MTAEEIAKLVVVITSAIIGIIFAFYLIKSMFED